MGLKVLVGGFLAKIIKKWLIRLKRLLYRFDNDMVWVKEKYSIDAIRCLRASSFFSV